MTNGPDPKGETRGVLRSIMAADAPEPLQRRGADYWARGAVRLSTCTAEEATAVVRGTRPYTLRLSIADGQLSYHCECPHAARGAMCKHVWAFVLEVEHAPRCREFVVNVAGLPKRVARASATIPQAVSQPTQPGAPRPSPSSATLEAQRWRKLVTPPMHPAAELLGESAGETWYLIDLHKGGRSPYDWRKSLLLIHTAHRNRTKRGALTKPIRFGKAPEGQRPGGIEGLVWALARNGVGGVVSLSLDLALEVLPELAQLGRLGAVWGPHGKDVTPLQWDGAVPWQVELVTESYTSDAEIDAASLTASGVGVPKSITEVRATLSRRNGAHYENLDPKRIDALLPLDLFVCAGKIARLDPAHAPWVDELNAAPLRLGPDQLAELQQGLRQSRRAPRLQGAIDSATTSPPPGARLRMSLPEKSVKLIRGGLTFLYGDREVGASITDAAVASVSRNYDGEMQKIEELRKLGVEVQVQLSPSAKQVFALAFDAARFADLLPQLIGLGFDVEVEGQKARRLTSWTPVLVQSGLDWFGIEGAPDFEGELAGIPELLQAIKRRRSWVKLRNGGIGMLPQQWLDSLAELAEWMPPRAKELRLHAIQGKVAERALGRVSDVRTSRAVAEMCERLDRFKAITPLDEPSTFKGQLRDYQRLAMGWLSALDDLGFGGCLADDMGLGKTIVVLAWLLRRKTRRAATDPSTSLLVVPTSLLFNWQREAERFAPDLAVLIHHGAGRIAPGDHFAKYDVVITSYGTLRRDADRLAALHFDYVILDEAHAIKNAWTESYTAANGLLGRRRLALTGTPVENHLGELWSLLLFLNPEVLSGMSHLQRYFEKRKMAPSDIEHGVLRALAPFILRRTKSDVARDLPERIEKTLMVRLSKAERKQYDELAEYYKKRLLETRAISKRHKQAGGAGGQQTAEILVALLRLRQTACHTGLLDTEQRDAISAKFNILLTHLSALHAEGHKALVFSQFTELLQLLMPHLDRAGIRYEHLDGSTRDREARIDRFSNDPDVGVFLISLKAGGVGLNLVAAEYVFLLDPWWNPASEAQAIDRAHRIGQHKTVIAYRLLAEGTVEEKVAQLQDEKRAMALSLFGDETNFSARFTKQDLELLLGSTGE